MERRIGLFGGTFDPVHLGHLFVAEQCREGADLAEVWFLPAGVPPHKRRDGISPFADRCRMIELAIADNPGFRLEILEGERAGPSFTVDTLQELRHRHPNADFHFVLGADGIVDLPTWHRPNDLLDLCSLCVVRRPGFPNPDMDGLAARLGRSPGTIRFRIVDMPLVEISSREIRERGVKGKSIRYRVPEAVRRWIGEKNLYGAHPVHADAGP